MSRKMFFYLGALAAFMMAVLLLGYPVGAQPSPAGKLQYPQPRYPKIPRITTLEELLPFARTVVNRDVPTLDAAIMQPSYGRAVKGGERVLLVDLNWDPLVTEALTKAFEEKNCKVEVFRRAGRKETLDVYQMPEADSMERWLQGKGGYLFGLGLSEEENQRLRKAMGEADYVIGGYAGHLQKTQRMPWLTRELLAGAGAQFLPELNDAVNKAAWRTLRQAYKIHLTDPEGTDLRFTWFPEYWQVIEGTHPHIKTKATAPSGTFGAGYLYQPGASEQPLFSNHLMGVPAGIVLEKSDGTGVAAATAAHQGPSPWVKLTIQKHRIVAVEGGGRYGQIWRDYVEKFKSVKYPLHPEAGVGFWIEAAIGSNPKAYRPHNVVESITARDAWVDERVRSGVTHLGFGQNLKEGAEWARERNVPAGHYHLHLYFPTYTLQTRDGKQLKLIDQGHLMALDDPEVRELAAKYGNPDELLKENWIPAIPGVNVPGDYLKDYAPDPAAWIKKEHRQAYGAILDFRPYP